MAVHVADTCAAELDTGHLTDQDAEGETDSSICPSSSSSSGSDEDENADVETQSQLFWSRYNPHKHGVD
jgi:hypothetical protein